jgi:hypothetical protein
MSIILAAAMIVATLTPTAVFAKQAQADGQAHAKEAGEEKS